MRNKKMIIAMLCIAACVMTIGFAAFSTQLTINGTANISSTWKVVFSNIEEVSKTDGVKINNIAQASGTTATFNVSLTNPGDKIVYKITVANQGTLNAIVNDIAISDTGSDAIIFEVDGINKDDKLAKQSTTTFNVIIKYDESITDQPSVLNNTLRVNITYIQDIEQSSEGGSSNIVANSLAAKILSDNNVQNGMGSVLESTINGYSRLVSTNVGTENNQTTYYFTGNPQNNYVSFANKLWRIIRINEDGSIRMILDDSEYTVGQGVSFNDNTDIPLNMRVGYMYGEANSTTLKDGFSNIYDSTMKKYLDKWYEDNLKTNYASYLADAGFCNDRSVVSGTSLTDELVFAVEHRLRNNKAQFACPNPDDDLFTTKTSNKGNKALKYPIGLITADEIYYTGLPVETNLSERDTYILNMSTWSMSPLWTIYPSHAVDAPGYYPDGSIVYGDLVNAQNSSIRNGAFPVINLRADVEVVSGDGWFGSEYVIE